MRKARRGEAHSFYLCLQRRLYIPIDREPREASPVNRNARQAADCTVDDAQPSGIPTNCSVVQILEVDRELSILGFEKTQGTLPRCTEADAIWFEHGVKLGVNQSGSGERNEAPSYLLVQAPARRVPKAKYKSDKVCS